MLAGYTIYDHRMKTTTLGRLIRERRDALKLTQEEAAEKMGVERNWLAQVENDRVVLPGPDKLERLERYFGLSREDVLRAAGYLGPAMGVDLIGELRRIAVATDLEDKIRLVEALPPEVQDALEAAALQLVREQLRRGRGSGSR